MSYPSDLGSSGRFQEPVYEVSKYNIAKINHVNVMDIEQDSIDVDDFDVSPEQMTTALHESNCTGK